MELDDFTFSDVIIHENGRVYLKGTAGESHRLVKPENTLKKDIAALHQVVKKTERGRDTFRISHGGTSYRVAVYDGVEWGSGKVYFLRKAMHKVPGFASLGYASYLSDWLLDKEQRKGLVLFSGSQASGKTTSASSLISSRLEIHGGHAVSFENPVEMPLDGNHGEFGVCFQAEIESEAELGKAIEKAHRYASPDIIYIGEIRGKYAASETLRIALGSDQQLVIATIHGLGPIPALERLIGMAREIDGDLAYQNLSQSLLAIVHQHLADEEGKRVLNVDDALFLPFPGKEKADSYAGVRAKLKNGDLSALAEDFNEQAARFVLYGRRT